MTNRIKATAVSGAEQYVPVPHNLPALREAVQSCRGCNLYRNATQAVFGELMFGEVDARTSHSSSHAQIMMIGEQPGDKEDIEGRPFVGPAGKLLDQCLQEADIDRKSVYVTNTVKHFKWEPRGKFRLHKKPSLTEIRACRPWLDAELDTVRPSLIVCLGATAAQALLGSKFRQSWRAATRCRPPAHRCHCASGIHPARAHRPGPPCPESRLHCRFAQR